MIRLITATAISIFFVNTCQAVIVLFHPAAPEIGPFPSDTLTVEDRAQKTGKRVQLPEPDCQLPLTSCNEIGVINQYDGFSLAPRIRVRFSGRVNVDTLRPGIFLVALDNLTDEEFGTGPAGKAIPVNQLVYDPATNTVYAEPDEVLDQHRRYGVVVTRAVLDAAGRSIYADPEFARCLSAAEPSCRDLAAAMPALEDAASARGSSPIVAASVFTTMSATAWLERARDALDLMSPHFERGAGASVFNIAELSSLVIRRQTRSDVTQDSPIPLALLAAVGRIAFGSIRSPRFTGPDGRIPATPTAAEISSPAFVDEIALHAFLPQSPKPSSGYPVVVAGHGFGDSRFGFPSGIAGTLAAAGFATVAINAVGHGGGPNGIIAITANSGSQTEIPLLGRSQDLDNNGAYDAIEGCLLVTVAFRDCFRQTAVDLMQLVRAIRLGMDLDGDGNSDLDGSRIYYFGQSLGAMYGSLLTAVDPLVPSSVLNVGGATVAETARWSPTFRPLLGLLLATRVPPAANRGLGFDEEYVRRHEPVRIASVEGAVDIQNIHETLEWIGMPGDPLAYAPHFWTTTLPFVPIKRVLFQHAAGDATVPNIANSALLRAANMQNWSVLYRHDRARAVSTELPANPHAFVVQFGSLTSAAIALAAQRQAAGFLAAAEECGLERPCIPDVDAPFRQVYGVSIFEIDVPVPER